MRQQWYRKALQLLQELRRARGAKFLYMPECLSWKGVCRAVYYEYTDPRAADEILIEQLLYELYTCGYVPRECLMHYRYQLGEVTFHDVYLRTTDGGLFCRGTSIDFAEACAKAIGEVLERTSLKYNDDPETRVGSVRDLQNAATPHLSPATFAQPTATQKETFPNFVVTDFDEFSWVQAINVRTEALTWVPAQTVFYNNFITYPSEKTIVLQSTHGAGGGYTRSGAIRSAIGEIVHRHFFLSGWYAAKIPPKVDPASVPADGTLRLLIRSAERTGFTVHLLDYSSEAGLPTIVCVLERYGGWTMGASTSQTLRGAIDRAVSEAMATYLWQVQTTTKGGNRLSGQRLSDVRHDFTDTRNSSAYQRVMLYSSSAFVEQTKYCKEFLSGTVAAYTTAHDVAADFDYEQYAVRVFGDVYVYEVKKQVLTAYDYHAVRAIIPQSYPFALNETYSRPVLNGKQPRNAQLTPFP